MNDEQKIHLPSPSFWPIVLALGLTLIAIGVVTSIAASILGVVVILASIAGWTMENRAAEQGAHHE
jgi:cytochrome c oxidase subunit 1